MNHPQRSRRAGACASAGSKLILRMPVQQDGSRAPGKRQIVAILLIGRGTVTRARSSVQFDSKHAWTRASSQAASWIPAFAGARRFALHPRTRLEEPPGSPVTSFSDCVYRNLRKLAFASLDRFRVSRSIAPPATGRSMRLAGGEEFFDK